MWVTINHVLVIAEIILAAVGILFVWGRKNALKTFIFLSFVFVLNFTIYSLPALYDKLVLKESRNFIFYLLDIFPATIKSLVGDTSTGMVEGYTTLFPSYTYIYLTGMLLGFLSTSFAVISTFGNKILNTFRVAKILSGATCDIITGSSADALNYARSYKKTIIALSENTDKSVSDDLINSGYNIIRKKVSARFLNSRFFNCKTKYNIISLSDAAGHYDQINNFLSYFGNNHRNKKIHFYIETEEKAISTEKNYLDAAGDNFRDCITLFSRNELIARSFVDENPITKELPEAFFDDDTSIKENVNLNIFMLGFKGLSREIYRQFIMNNQLSVYKDGEYRAFPVNYFIYDKGADKKIWEIDGLSDTLSALSENSDSYFPIPDMPYNTKCIQEDCYEFDCLKEIARKIENENSFSYILIDTADIYKNIEIAERFNLLLNKLENFRIFIYNSSDLPTDSNIKCYGNTTALFTHDIIVNESLDVLAKNVNTFYSGTDNWHTLSYFDMYSNIALASNLRLKLNLLGLDYLKDDKAEGYHLIENITKNFGADGHSYNDYFEKSTRNALLAQEHFRWNAYHLLSGYLPMKKARVSVEMTDDGKIKKTAKNNMLKKHACLTTFKGLDELSLYLADKANQLADAKTYTATDFDYYKYDDLLLRTMPDFFKENNYSVIKRAPF